MSNAVMRQIGLGGAAHATANVANPSKALALNERVNHH